MEDISILEALAGLAPATAAVVALLWYRMAQTEKKRDADEKYWKDEAQRDELKYEKLELRVRRIEYGMVMLERDVNNSFGYLRDPKNPEQVTRKESRFIPLKLDGEDEN